MYVWLRLLWPHHLMGLDQLQSSLLGECLVHQLIIHKRGIVVNCSFYHMILSVFGFGTFRSVVMLFNNFLLAMSKKILLFTFSELLWNCWNPRGHKCPLTHSLTHAPSLCCTWDLKHQTCIWHHGLFLSSVQRHSSAVPSCWIESSQAPVSGRWWVDGLD